jgi:glycosyltransferase involved in cell wall biosynthesis
MSPLLSIVVPTRNQAAFIEETLASILGQNWPRLELIVIDGASTDGTQEIVQRYPVTHFVSEKDRGQSEAINKGFRLAKGEILAWINSDDYFLPMAFQRAVAALGDPAVPQLIYGHAFYWYAQEDRANVVRARPYDRMLLRRNCYLTQPSTFWTRALWEKTGEINEELQFAMDWEYWLRASAHCDFRPLDANLSVYRFHPAHKTSGRHARRSEELVAIMQKFGDPEWLPAYRDVAARLDSLVESWDRHGASAYRLHKLRHLDLYMKHGDKVDEIFWQLHV